MSQIQGKWIADGAITPSKMNTSGTFEVGGLIVDGSNAVGNIAVGTNTALDKLHLRSTSVRTGIRLDLDDGASGRTYQIASKSTGVFDITDMDSTKSRITVSPLGKVGLTIADPLDMLHVVADGTNATSAALRLDMDNGALGRAYKLVSDTDGALKIVDLDASDTIFLISPVGDTTVAYDLRVGDKLYVGTDATIGGNLRVTGDMIIDDIVLDEVNMNDATIARTLTTGGRVGIGASPNASYLVNGVLNSNNVGSWFVSSNNTTGATSYAGFSAIGAGGNNIFMATATVNNGSTHWQNKGVIYSSGNAGMLLEQQGGYPVRVYTNATSRLTVDGTSGGVGITTDYPKGRGLQISAAGAVVHSGTGANVGLNITRNAYWDGADFRRLLADNEAGRLNFSNDGGLSYSINTDASSTVDSVIIFSSSIFDIIKVGAVGRIAMTGDVNIVGKTDITGNFNVTGGDTTVNNLRVLSDASVLGSTRTAYLVVENYLNTVDANIYGNAVISGNCEVVGDSTVGGDIQVGGDLLNFSDSGNNVTIKHADLLSGSSANYLNIEASDYLGATALASGGYVNITAGDSASATGIGGYVILTPGTGTSANGRVQSAGDFDVSGDATVIGGLAVGKDVFFTTSSADSYIRKTATGSGDGYILSILGGNTTDTTTNRIGGYLYLKAGDSADSSYGTGGHAWLVGGNGKYDDGTGGNVYLNPGTGNQAGFVRVGGDFEVTGNVGDLNFASSVTPAAPVYLTVGDTVTGAGRGIILQAGNTTYTGGGSAGGGAVQLLGGDSSKSATSAGKISLVAGNSTHPSSGIGGDIELTVGTGSLQNGVILITGDTTTQGGIDIQGTLTKLGGTFLIDHPLDPENKVLRHSFVESPEMRNLYFGIANTINGFAVISLPDWWTALNGTDVNEYSYTLTPIGGYSRLFVSEDISENKFEVTSLDGDCKFSWMVSAIRHDKFALENPVIVEEQKAEPGKMRY